MPRLSPLGRSAPVALAHGVRLVHHNLRGEVAPLALKTTEPAEVASLPPALARALANANASTVTAVHVRPLATSTLASRLDDVAFAFSPADPEPALGLEAPPPAPGTRRVTLSVRRDTGYVRWGRPTGIAPSGLEAFDVLAPARRGVADVFATLLGDLKGPHVAADQHLLMFDVPIVSEFLDRALDDALTALELRLLGYGVRRLTADDYGAPTDGARGDAAADAFRSIAAAPGRRALIAVHGGFARSWWTFAALPRGFVVDLAATYQGQLFAFDHPTMAETPQQNARQLADWLRAAGIDKAVTLDFLCHSRGGLVARDFAAEYGGEFTVGRTVFVGTPNMGTRLTDSVRAGGFVQMYANLVVQTGVPLLNDILGLVIQVAGHAAVRVLDQRPGIQAMFPGSALLRDLDVSPALDPRRCFAVGSDYVPGKDASPFLREIAAMVDAEMASGARVPNDLVVPTDGVFGDRTPGRFRVPDGNAVTFGAADHVWHLDYFRQPATEKSLRAWLLGP